jgi:2-keto-3-deoxy-L-rhamnonate aldolase RhmA
MVETAEEAAAAVSFARFPPHGRRSAGGVRPLSDLGGYPAGAGAAPGVIVMVETAAGLDNVAAIAAVPGVDMVFIGTGDLALSMGVPFGGPEHEAACASILAACTAAGRACGIFTGDLPGALARRAQGYRMVVTATDIGALGTAFGAAARGFGGR